MYDDDMNTEQAAPQSNVLGIVGFILAFCTGPIGLIISLIALRKAPRGFAIAGVVVGLITTAIAAVIGISVAAGWKYIGAGIDLATDYEAIRTEMADYQTANGAYPPDLATAGLSADAQTDPWGAAYGYEVSADGTVYTITSNGPDGQAGTGDDIVLDSDMTEDEIGEAFGDSFEQQIKDRANQP